MRSPRFLAVVALLLVATITLHTRAEVDRVPPSSPISELPTTMGSLTSRDITIDPGVLQLLGSGSFLNRIYTSPEDGPSNPGPIGLFIGYFPTQRTGQAIHSPQNCLPGAGWTFLSSGKITIPNLDGNVGEYVITNGNSKQLVLYWYRAHGRSIANDYAAKAYMMFDAIRYNRTDGALIRVITPIQEQETFEVAHDRGVKFASSLATMLPRFIPD